MPPSPAPPSTSGSAAAPLARRPARRLRGPRVDVHRDGRRGLPHRPVRRARAARRRARRHRRPEVGSDRAVAGGAALRRPGARRRSGARGDPRREPRRAARPRPGGPRGSPRASCATSGTTPPSRWSTRGARSGRARGRSTPTRGRTASCSPAPARRPPCPTSTAAARAILPTSTSWRPSPAPRARWRAASCSAPRCGRTSSASSSSGTSRARAPRRSSSGPAGAARWCSTGRPRPPTPRPSPPGPPSRRICGAGASPRSTRRDDRGVAVIGASRRSPTTPWTLLVKEDEADTLAPLRDRAARDRLRGARPRPRGGLGRRLLDVAPGAALRARPRRRRGRAERPRRAARAAHELRPGHGPRGRRRAAARRGERAGRGAARLLRARSSSGWTCAPCAIRRRWRTTPTACASRRSTAPRSSRPATGARTGTTFPVQVSIHTESYEGRRYFEAIVRDLSDVKRAEEALRESEAKFRAAFEHTILGVLLAGPDGPGDRDEPLAAGDVRLRRGGAARHAHRRARRSAPDAGRRARRLPRAAARRGGPPRAPAGGCGGRTAADVETVVRASALRDAQAGAAQVRGRARGGRLREEAAARRSSCSRTGWPRSGRSPPASPTRSTTRSPSSSANLDVRGCAELRRAPGRDAPRSLRALEDAKDGGARVREIVRDLKTLLARRRGACAHAARRAHRARVGHRPRVERDPPPRAARGATRATCRRRSPTSRGSRRCS